MRTITDRSAGFGWMKRLAWFVGLWLAGVVTVGAVSIVLRWALRAP